MEVISFGQFLVLLLVAIVFFAIVIYGVEKRGWFRESEEEQHDGVDRVSRQEEDRGERYRIAIRDKHRQLPIEGKIAMISVAAIIGLFVWITYEFYRAGSPADVLYLEQVRYGILVLVGGICALGLRGWKRNRYGKLHIEYESQDGESVDETETIHFDTRHSFVREGEAGKNQLVVREVFPTWYFFLFRRYKLVGHDRELRRDRPPGQHINHVIPHNRVEIDENEFRIRTQGRDPIPPGVDAAGDVRYKPPIKLNWHEYQRQREVNEKKDARLKSMAAQLAQAYREIDDLIQIIENEEYMVRQDVKEELHELRSIVGHQTQQYRFEGTHQPAARPPEHATNGTSGGEAGQSRQGQQGRASAGGDGR